MSTQEEQEDLRCRFCMAEEVDELVPLFCIASTQQILISHMALACTGVVVSCRDNLPQYTCDKCLGKLDVAYACWKRCRQSWGNYKELPAHDPESEDYRCRICLKEEVEELISLFCICDSHSMKISDIIRRFAGLDVAPNDKFPQYICDVCLGELNTGFDFRQQARKSNAILRPNLIKQQFEKMGLKQTNKSSNSVLHESSNFGDSSEVNYPKVREQSTANKSKEIISHSSTPTNLSQVEPNVLTPVKKIGQTVVTKLAKDPMVMNVGQKQHPKATSVQSASGIQPNLKKASFSSPTEFKKLASKILKKPDHEPSPASMKQQGRTVLAANEIKILYKMPRFTRSQITAFLCKNCSNVCSASAIQSVCIKCKLRFDNYLPIELERLTIKQGYVDAYCCKQCTFFSVTLDKLMKHLPIHGQKVDNRAAVPVASSETAEKQSVSPVVPQSQSIKPASNKRPAKERNTPIAKRRHSDGQKSKSELKVPKWKPDERWVRVEPSSFVTEVRIVDTDDSISEGPELQDELQEIQVEETDIKFEDDPLDIIETTAVVRTDSYSCESSRANVCVTTVTMTHSDRNEQLDHDEFIGFEELLSETPQTPPSVGRSVMPLPSSAGRTLDKDFFDILKETNAYILCFLKGYLCCGCLQPFKSLDQLKIHRSLTHSKQQPIVDGRSCGMCRTSYTGTEDHRVLSSKRIFYYCKLCRSLLLSVDDFNSHRESHHATETDSHLLPSSPASKVLDVSLAKLKPKLSLRNPENTAHYPNPFKMTENEAIFKTLNETKDYKLLFMKGELCCGCGEWYGSKKALQDHCSKRHTAKSTPESTTPCELCHIDCRTDSRLIRHQLYRVRRLYYFCKICREALVHDPDNYQAHQAIAHWVQLNPQASVSTENLGLLVSKVAE